MRLFRILTVAVGLGGFGIAAGGASCNPVSDFQCTSDQNCVDEGLEMGVCELNRFCSYADPTCLETGRRWHDRASSLGGMCLEDGMMTATDTDDPTMGTGSSTGGSSSGTTEAASSSSGDPTTGDPLTTGDPTTGDPSTTGGSSSSGTGAAMTCDMQYGGATDYMLCDEMPDSCRFNVTIAMASNCTGVCESFGGMCMGAQLNDMDACTSTGDTTCDDMTVNDLICICSR